MKWIIALVMCLSVPAMAGLEEYARLIPPVAESHVSLNRDGVRVTYLGTNGYLLESRDTTLLVDPYFSRMSFPRAALGLRTVGRPDWVRAWMSKVDHVDGILVTHGHVDHLYDVPQIMELSSARLIASPTSVWLARASGISAARCRPVLGGEPPILVGHARIWPFRATHDRVLGRVPFEGTLERMPARRPATIADWKCGEPLAFLVELGGRRIFIKSGSALGDEPPAGLGRIDLAILGLATPDARAVYPKALKNLQPQFIVPSHQDDFFRPVDRPFVFLAGSDFPDVLRKSGEFTGRIRLLRPFQPWMLP